MRPSQYHPHPNAPIVEFLKYFEHVKELKFQERPNYSYLRSLFRDLFYSSEPGESPAFDWTANHVAPLS